ncbi:hypothetical protein PAHAL_8G236300 [Panicum hallii]|uniref:Receptor kinase-like protein Xa21 n=1 Tax=Panicum hallii TaxID=206008 RepID=A0A2S3IEZ1_9POAL|nr:hypothetical protein PAHAL_8G236300 [Panicum hallii]
MAILGAQKRSFVQLVATLTISILIAWPCPCSLARASTLHNSSETDRQALLCLKTQLSSPAGAFDSWREDSLSFCDWRGVSCSGNKAARVVALHLAELNITGKFSPCIADLHFIDTIDMAYNQINGPIPPEIGNLTRLKYLNLSMNSITGAIPDSISFCSKLEVIRLMNNSIEGEIPPSLAKLQLLQQIVLSNNKLGGRIPLGIGLLPKLQYLFLPSNNFVGSIPESLGSSPSLAIVVVRNNSLTGGLPLMLTNCSTLYYLDLMQNKLSGNIPSTLFNSTSLVTLDLSDNGFSGVIPSCSMMSPPIQYISLAKNSFSGVIPATFGNFSFLSTLLLSENNLQGSIPESLARIQVLQELDMAYNNLSGAVPQKLYNKTSLSELGLGVNQLVGRIPSDIGNTLPNIETLVMEGNKFEGPLPVTLVNASKLQALELRDNAFTGVVPSYWSLPNLIQLDLENNFTGTIPSEIGNLKNLTILQLGGNKFLGTIPATLGNLDNLFILSLAHNNLFGEIPQSIGKLERLSELYVQENNLSGSIPPSLGGCKSMVILNLSHNVFQGSIPPELLTISSLSGGLDLSYNKLTGSIPSNVGDLINLESLDISNNQLSGEIPHTLGECLHLESIHLEVNFLSGSIPSSIMSLRGMTEMDLSQNNLSGEIPVFLETFSTLQLLNLSFNNLEGVVPTGGVFGNSSKVHLQGNKKLCAADPVLQLQLPVCMSAASRRNKTSYIISIAVPLASVVMILTACSALIICKKRIQFKNSRLDQPCKELKKISYSDVANATNEFSSDNLVGSGQFGTVYKGTFKFEAHPVAVKVFKLDQLGAPKSFFAECEALRNTRHRNLIRVVSLCSSLDQMGNEFKALILEYMGNGTLESWLHHPKVDTQSKMTRVLDLGSRILVAVDIAAALDYLHNWCRPPLVHCDLKPSNVLLDDDMVAHVSDFGLAKFLHGCDSSARLLMSSTNIAGPRGSIGYIAPEYGMGLEISTAGDVYSYGVILLEMITGKRPTDDIFTDGLNLHRFVESANVGEIQNSSLLAPYHDGVGEARRGDSDCYENRTILGIRSCVEQLAELGLKCSADSPGDRPAIHRVYAEVVAIREAFSSALEF